MKAAVMMSLVGAMSAINAQGLAGGWFKVDVTDDTKTSLLNAMTKSDSNYASSIGSKRVCVAKILSLDQQVVAGMNYRFHVLGCPVDSFKLAGWCMSDCTPQGYVIQIFEQGWTDTLQVTGILEENAEATPVAEGEDDEAPPTPEVGGSISSVEKTLIDKWIKDNNLNAYGDKKGTMYLGGTPLFDENTGEQVDLYDYILRQHPNRPWLPSKEDSNAVVHPVNLAAEGPSYAHDAPATSGAIAVMVIAVFGVMVGMVGMVATIKARRTQHRFRYNSLRSREI